MEQYIHENGWTAVTKPFPSQAEAEAEHLSQYAALDTPSRVYEALDHPNYKQRNR